MVLSRSNAEVRKAVKNARRDHYARPRTAPDMHHDASYEVASSAEVIQGRTARSRPSATRVHSAGWGKGLTLIRGSLLVFIVHAPRPSQDPFFVFEIES